MANPCIPCRSKYGCHHEMKKWFAVVFGKVPSRASCVFDTFSCFCHCRNMLFVSRAVLFSCASLHFPRVLLCCLTLLVAFIVACWHGRVCSGGGVGWGGVGRGGGVGGGGGWGGMITFLFINVPACAFLTRCSFVCALSK